jgi:hypothetical protein
MGNDKLVPVLYQLRITTLKHMGECRHSFTILDLGTRWRSVVSFTPSSFIPEERASGNHYSLESGLSRPQIRSREKSLAPVDNCIPVVPSIAIPTPLFRLLVAEDCGHVLSIKHEV